jgi:2-oxoglutarate ferredoxin oxidoreductase subunit alpha
MTASAAKPETVSETSRIAVALIGSGGSGVVTAGDLLLRAAAKAGWYGLMVRSAGPQIRGGESAAYVVLSEHPVATAGDRFDLVLAIDWNNADRFIAEVPLQSDSLVIGGVTDSEPPPEFTGARLATVDLKAVAKSVAGGRPNMVALGIVAELVGIPGEPLAAAIDERLGKRSAEAASQGLAAVDAGRAAARDLDSVTPLASPSEAGPGRWVMTGNQAAGLGALRGGIRFVAAYPITPATEILEWLAPRIEQVGGSLTQAEDELASINMAIGASYGGVPALTATSGPGLALMLESVGLAVSAEVPVVVIDVMRGGPSTGIPTKSEQGDLNIAVYGLPGDAPHVVVAPTSIADCLFTTQWAVHLAESLQTPAIVLSDQAFGQTTAVLEPPPSVAFAGRREVVEQPAPDYMRYALTPSGVSPMSLPGTAGGQYTADGLEHTPRGAPSSKAEDHIAQLDKRRDKVLDFDYGDAWADVDGAGDIVVVTWGSMTGATLEAARRLDPEGKRIRVVALRLIAPAQPERLGAVLAGARHILVVEQSHGAQLYHYLRSHYGLPDAAEPYARPGPLPIRPGEIEAKLEGWSAS